MIEGWPVQFLPVADELDADALAAARNVELPSPAGTGPVQTRVLRAEHIVAIALRTGRPKDRLRVLQFLQEDVVDLALLCGLLERHGLNAAFARFCRETGLTNPCVVNQDE